MFSLLTDIMTLAVTFFFKIVTLFLFWSLSSILCIH